MDTPVAPRPRGILAALKKIKQVTVRGKANSPDENSAAAGNSEQTRVLNHEDSGVGSATTYTAVPVDDFDASNKEWTSGRGARRMSVMKLPGSNSTAKVRVISSPLASFAARHRARLASLFKYPSKMRGEMDLKHVLLELSSTACYILFSIFPLYIIFFPAPCHYVGCSRSA
jgi:hypothetical protein